MKRIISLLTIFAILLSFTAVSANTTLEDMYIQLMTNPITEGKLKANVQLNCDIPALAMYGQDGNVLAALMNSSADYELNVNSDDAVTKVQADGRMMFNSGAESYGIPSVGMDIWMNMDVENTEDIQYFIIMKLIGDDLSRYFGEISDKYVYIDYTQIPGFKEVISKLSEMGFFNRDKINELIEEAINNEDLMDLIRRIYKNIDINPTYSDGGYSIVLGDAEIKDLYINLFNNIVDFAVEVSGDYLPADKYALLEEAKNEAIAVINSIKDVQIFDAERGIVSEISADGRTAYAEVNINTNIYDIMNVIDPASASAMGMFDKSFFDIKLSAVANMNVEPLPEGYQVSFPELTEDNTYEPFSMIYGQGGMDNPVEDMYVPEEIIEIVYNDMVVNFDNKPLIINDRTFLPFRQLANMFGIDNEHIGYDEATERVYLKSGDIEIEMYIGSSTAYVNGEKKELDVPAFTSEDRTYIPARFVSEMFGKTVGYANENGVQTITISD